MERAAVLIGVNSTGQLDKLNAAVPGATKMYAWARKQGIPDGHIRLITDDGGNAVTVRQIKDAVSAMANLGSVEQLIIYFAGHGIWNNSSEYWLLSDAPNDPNEAVNIEQSVNDARIGVFNHVVFFSDACRSIAQGFQFNRINGSSIFSLPQSPADPERSVDLFFACGFSSVSKETKAADATTWTSVYTDVLHDTLSGNYPAALDQDNHDASISLVKTQKLKPFLTKQVPQIIADLKLGYKAQQRPDARICSDMSAWVSLLARVEAPPAVAAAAPFPTMPPTVDLTSSFGAPKSGGAGFGFIAGMGEVAGVIGNLFSGSKRLNRFRPKPPEVPEGFNSVEESALSKALDDDATDVMAMLPPSAVTDTAAIIAEADEKTPPHFETGCGFVINGQKPVQAIVAGEHDEARFELTDEAVKVVPIGTGANVLIVFRDGTGTLLPAFNGYIATLTFESSNLISVSWRLSGQVETPELRNLRALVSSMSLDGRFHLDPTITGREMARKIAERLRDSKMEDLGMAIYAAYAFYDSQLTSKISAMADVLAWERGIALYDLALLTRSVGKPLGRNMDVYPTLPFPLLARGWSLMSREKLPPSLTNFFPHLINSQWLLFDAEGVAMMKNAIQNKEIA